MKYHFAPIQGHTDAPYRHFHNLVYGSDTDYGTDYYTPFIRLDGGELRKRDVKDFTSSLNEGFPNIPQIIFRDEKELNSLVTLLKKEGVKRIDLNMGCPFPLQTGHKRGAATVANKNVAAAVAETVDANPEIEFSVKMRLGMVSPDEWHNLIPELNHVKLSHIAVHPRVARQQYDGALHLDQFEEILNQSTNPIVYNGDLRTPDDVLMITERFPSISGIMIGRGLLGRPSLINELTSGEEWSREKRLSKMIGFHRRLLDHYESTLCGDAQIISKIQPFWEYTEDEIGRKAWKAIKKAGNMAKYHSAVALVGQQ